MSLAGKRSRVRRGRLARKQPGSAAFSARTGDAMVIIVVRSKINGRWTYCPKDARHLLRPEQQEDAPFPTVADALNAIQRDRTMPRDVEVEIEREPS